MGWKVNKSAVSHARELIDQGKYVMDSDWSESQASTSKENSFIKKEGWQAYADWHLAYDPSKDEETKERYGFPFGDFKKVHRSGLNAIQQRAGQYDYDDILKAGDDLVKRIDKKDKD